MFTGGKWTQIIQIQRWMYMFMYMYILYTILILHVSQKALNINILYNVRETVMKQKTIFKNQTKTHKKSVFYT